MNIRNVLRTGTLVLGYHSCQVIRDEDLPQIAVRSCTELMRVI